MAVSSPLALNPPPPSVSHLILFFVFICHISFVPFKLLAATQNISTSSSCHRVLVLQETAILYGSRHYNRKHSNNKKSFWNKIIGYMRFFFFDLLETCVH